MFEKMSLGGYTVRLVMEGDIRDEEHLLGEELKNDELWEYSCTIDNLKDVVDKIPSLIKKITGKSMFSGYYRDIFYTIMHEYGLVAMTCPGEGKTWVGLKKELLGKKSAYLIQTILRTHIYRRMFAENKVPMHASAVIGKDSNYAIIVIGQSGSGKSSMGWNLIKRGFLMLADDCLVCHENGCISGSGGRLAVTDSFFNWYSPDVEREEVSPGRKWMLSVSSCSRHHVLPKVIIFPEVEPTGQKECIEKLELNEIPQMILGSHSNWCFNDSEKVKLAGAANRLIQHIECALRIRLNDRIDMTLDHLPGQSAFFENMAHFAK